MNNLFDDIYKFRNALKNKSGIYQIINIKNGKSYIGSSVNLNERLLEHRRTLLKNNHGNSRLQNSFNLHGKEFFFFKILKFTSSSDRDVLMIEEQYFIDSLSPYYNILKTAYRNSSYRHTDEAKEKIRISGIGRRTNNKPIVQLDFNLNKIAEYDSIAQACFITNSNNGNVGEVCRYYAGRIKNNKKHFVSNGFVWLYKENYIQL